MTTLKLFEWRIKKMKEKPVAIYARVSTQYFEEAECTLEEMFELIKVLEEK